MYDYVCARPRNLSVAGPRRPTCPKMGAVKQNVVYQRDGSSLRSWSVQAPSCDRSMHLRQGTLLPAKGSSKEDEADDTNINSPTAARPRSVVLWSGADAIRRRRKGKTSATNALLRARESTRSSCVCQDLRRCACKSACADNCERRGGCNAKPEETRHRKRRAPPTLWHFKSHGAYGETRCH